MRATRIVFLVTGWPMLIAGIVMIGVSLLDPSDVALLLGVGGGGVSLVITGIVFLVVARFLRRLGGAESLEDGVPGTALVRSVTDTGITINNLNAVLDVSATITVPGRAPYEGNLRIVVGRTQWGAVQPGTTLPVLVERNDPTRIVHDPSRAALVGGLAPGSHGATRSAAEIISRGVPTQGVLHLVEHTGMTAGQAVSGLPPHEADDPVMRVVFGFVPSGGSERRNEVLLRIPDGKAHWLVPGATLPIAYLPDDPSDATIDWSRL